MMSDWKWRHLNGVCLVIAGSRFLFLLTVPDQFISCNTTVWSTMMRRRMVVLLVLMRSAVGHADAEPPACCKAKRLHDLKQAECHTCPGPNEGCQALNKDSPHA